MQALPQAVVFLTSVPYHDETAKLADAASPEAKPKTERLINGSSSITLTSHSEYTIIRLLIEKR